MPVNQYKEIIYLDETELTSALGQLQGGLKSSIVSTNQKNNSSSESLKTEGDAGAEFNAAVIKATLGTSLEETDTTANSTTFSKAINVVFGDYQLERLIHELGDNIKPSEFEPNEGDFVLATSSFQLLDFESTLEVLDGTTLKNVMKFIPDEDGGTSWDKATEQGFKGLEAISKLGSRMIPNSIVFLLNNATVYAEKENFRMSPAQIRPLMSTSREITVLGIVEGFAGSEKMEMDKLSASFGSGNFGDVGAMVSAFSETLMTALKVIKIGNQLIKPIAIYFGKTN